jgi:hypothetical protein
MERNSRSLVLKGTRTAADTRAAGGHQSQRRTVFEEEKRTASAFLARCSESGSWPLSFAFDRYSHLTQDSRRISDLTAAIEDWISQRRNVALWTRILRQTTSWRMKREERPSSSSRRRRYHKQVRYGQGDDRGARSDAVIYSISNSGSPRTLRVMSEYRRRLLQDQQRRLRKDIRSDRTRASHPIQHCISLEQHRQGWEIPPNQDRPEECQSARPCKKRILCPE